MILVILIGRVNIRFYINNVKKGRIARLPCKWYLLEVPDAVVTAEALLLAVHQQEVVGRRAVRQVVAALLAAVHDQAVGPAVHVETRVAADLVSHRLEAHLVANLQLGGGVGGANRSRRARSGQCTKLTFSHFHD